MIARAVIGLPGQTHAQVAEAYGCKVGFADAHGIAMWGPGGNDSGGNLNVVRYCAAEGRIRRPHIQELLEGPLGGLRSEGMGTEVGGSEKERERGGGERSHGGGVHGGGYGKTGYLGAMPSI